MRRPGFALVVVLATTSIITLLALACWHRVTLFVDVTQQHELYQKNRYKAEVVFAACLDVIKKHHTYFFSKKVKKDKPLEFLIESDSFKKDSASMRVVRINPECLWCKTTVDHGVEINCYVKRNIEKDGNGAPRYSFVVDYVTFSALL